VWNASSALIGQQYNSQWSYYGLDRPGSVRTLSDGSGMVTRETSYDSNGVPFAQSGNVQIPRTMQKHETHNTGIRQGFLYQLSFNSGRACDFWSIPHLLLPVFGQQKLPNQAVY